MPQQHFTVTVLTILIKYAEILSFLYPDAYKCDNFE